MSASQTTYDDDNVFAKILRGELPCDKVYEDEHVLAFRDLEPRRRVHVLVIPKGRYTSLEDFSQRASDEEMAAWVRAAARVARQEGISGSGYRVLSNVGEHGHQEVPHLHVHVLGGEDCGPMID